MAILRDRFVLLLVLPAACLAQGLTPTEALDRYLARTVEQPAECAGAAFEVKIEASLPKLRKRGSMSGLKLISQTGKVVYRGLRFTGDNLVKTAVIARYLAADTGLQEQSKPVAITRVNYTFIYDKTADYAGTPAFVFRLKPKRKQVGLFVGELWLESKTAAPLRLWGDFVKSPSIMVRNIRFVKDYQSLARCSQPVRLLVTVRTRIAGQAEMAVWMNSVKGEF